MLSYSESLPRCGIGRGWPRTRAGSTGCLLGANDQPGSTTHRFEGTTESAWKIIDSLSICWPAQHRPLALQREMVDKHLPLQRTTAGKTVLDSVEGYGCFQAQVAPTLQAAVGTAELVSIHHLKGVIAPYVSIAPSNETMTETRRALFQVL